MAERWKMAAELSQDRWLTLIVAKYGDDKMPIHRLTAGWHENCTSQEIANALRTLADQLDALK